LLCAYFAHMCSINTAAYQYFPVFVLMLQPYFVNKFLPPDGDDEDKVYEIGLTQWVLDNQAETYWPPKEELVPKYLERLQMADPLT